MPAKKTLKDLVEDVRQKGRITEIQPDRLRAMQQDQPGLVLIDVREPEERQREGSIPGAIGIARGVLERDLEKQAFAGEIGGDDLDRPVVLYCGGGSRSMMAGDCLAEMGFANLYSLAGGFEGYGKAGHKVDPPESPLG